MLIINYLVCLVQGHAFLVVTHKGSSYQYCLQCGKVASHIHNREALRQRVDVDPIHR